MLNPIELKNPSQACYIRIVASVLLGCALLLSGCVTSGDPIRPSSTTPEAELQRRAIIRVQLAASYFQQKRTSVAIDEANEALRIIPNFPAALGMLGIIYMELDDKVKAEDFFKRALQSAPRDSDINLNYGWFLCQTGRERESIPMFLVAANDRLYPAAAKGFQNAGVCARRIAKDGDAESYLRQALSLEPENSVALFHLAEIFLLKGDTTNAESANRRLLDLGANAQSIWQAIRIQRKLGNTAQVNSLATQLRRRFPESEELQRFIQGRYE